MPGHSVYALAPNFPRELRYHDGTGQLELTRGEIADEWVLRAKKVIAPKYCE